MKKTQSFIIENSKWNILNDYIERIDVYRELNIGLVLDNCKALIESIYKTIVFEVKDKTPEKLAKDNMGTLKAQVVTILKLEKRKLDKILEESSKTITNFRNNYGESSHGKDIYTLENNRNLLCDDEINFLVSTTDNISSFLLSYYKNLYPSFAEREELLKYEDFGAFNDWFDEVNPMVVISEAEFSPSKVLFENDMEMYKAELLKFKESESK